MEKELTNTSSENKSKFRKYTEKVYTDIKQNGWIKISLWFLAIILSFIIQQYISTKIHIYIFIFLLFFISFTILRIIVKQLQKRKSKIIAYTIWAVLMIISLIIFISLVGKPPNDCENPRSVYEYFECDSHTPFRQFHYIKPKNPDAQVKYVIEYDVNVVANWDTKTYSFYCYYNPQNYTHIIEISGYFQSLKDSLVNEIKTGKFWGEMSYNDKTITLKELNFSKQIYIYCNSIIPTNTREIVTQMYKEEGFTTEIRGWQYAEMENMKRDK